MGEIWKDIPGYEGLYQASSFGRIRNKYNKIIQHSTNTLGYQRLQLSKCGAPKNHWVHRLVWMAFNGVIPNGMVINHKDENPSNNYLDNLMLCTQKENLNWGSRNEKASKTKEKPIIKLSTSNEIIHFYSSIKQATNETGIKNISYCCNGKRQTAGGYIWKFAS